MSKEKVEETNQEEKEIQENSTDVIDNTEESKDLQSETEVNDQPAVGDELQEAKDKYLRLYSEFENFRRRTSRERLDLIGSATKELVIQLLPVMDDFERALKSIEEKGDAESKEGIELIYNKFIKILENQGVKKMEINPGDDFNDDYHEAITQIPADKKLEGKIVDVVESGYFLGDKVARFAKVVTGAKQNG